MPRVIELATTRDGKLALGEFQRIVLMEFEGPRQCQIEMRLLAEV